MFSHLAALQQIEAFLPLIRDVNELSISSVKGYMSVVIQVLTPKNMDLGNNETGSRSPCMRPSSDPAKMKISTQTTLPHFNFSVMAELNDVRSRLIILINEEMNEANCMVRNSAKLDRRTKQHTQFGVFKSDGSRDMAQTKSWRKKKEK